MRRTDFRRINARGWANCAPSPQAAASIRARPGGGGTRHRSSVLFTRCRTPGVVVHGQGALLQQIPNRFYGRRRHPEGPQRPVGRIPPVTPDAVDGLPRAASSSPRPVLAHLGGRVTHHSQNGTGKSIPPFARSSPDPPRPWSLGQRPGNRAKQAQSRQNRRVGAASFRNTRQSPMREGAKRSAPSAGAERARPERATRDVGAPPHHVSEEGRRLRRDSTRLVARQPLRREECRSAKGAPRSAAAHRG